MKWPQPSTYWDHDGIRYIVDYGDLIVLTEEYDGERWQRAAARPMTEDEIEEWRGPVKWWHWLRKRGNKRRLPVARLVGEGS